VSHDTKSELQTCSFVSILAVLATPQVVKQVLLIQTTITSNAKAWCMQCGLWLVLLVAAAAGAWEPMPAKDLMADSDLERSKRMKAEVRAEFERYTKGTPFRLRSLKSWQKQARTLRNTLTNEKHHHTQWLQASFQQFPLCLDQVQANAREIAAELVLMQHAQDDELNGGRFHLEEPYVHSTILATVATLRKAVDRAEAAAEAVERKPKPDAVNELNDAVRALSPSVLFTHRLQPLRVPWDYVTRYAFGWGTGHVTQQLIISTRDRKSMYAAAGAFASTGSDRFDPTCNTAKMMQLLPAFPTLDESWVAGCTLSLEGKLVDPEPIGAHYTASTSADSLLRRSPFSKYTSSPEEFQEAVNRRMALGTEYWDEVTIVELAQLARCSVVKSVRAVDCQCTQCMMRILLLAALYVLAHLRSATL
jgi:hypothetical protein